MAKAAAKPPEEYWYEAVIQVDMGFLGRDGRLERRARNAIEGEIIQKWYRFYPVDPERKLDNQLDCWLLTDRPLAPSYTELTVGRPRRAQGGVARQMNDPNAPEVGSGQRATVRMRSKVKFRLLDPARGEVSDHIRRNAKRLNLIESAYKDPEGRIPLQKAIDDGLVDEEGLNILEPSAAAS